MSKSYDILAIGNALMDIICTVEDEFFIKNDLQKGSMTLIDENQATSIYGEMGQTRQVSGGSAANTIAALSGIGINSAFIGSVSDDEIGKNFSHDLKATGVDLYGFVHPSSMGATGRCNVLVSQDAQRTMCTYLGCAGNIPVEALGQYVITKSNILYIEGYLWDQEVTKNTLIKAMDMAKESGNKVAFTLSDTFCVDRHRSDFLNLINDKFDIIFANEDEIKSLFQVENFNKAIHKCREVGKLFALTRAEKGAVIIHGDEINLVDAIPPSQLLDATGAGDSFAAGFLYGLIKNMSYYEAGNIGAKISSEVISHFGARAVNDLSKVI